MIKSNLAKTRKAASSAVQISGIDHAVRIVDRICSVTGSIDFTNELQVGGSQLRRILNRRDNAKPFDWLAHPIRESTIFGPIDAAPLRGKGDGDLPVQKGPPENWDAISIGHLVIAQETPDYGWAEAVVTGRTDDLLTLRYRDYPTIPKFYRHYRAVALLSQPTA